MRYWITRLGRVPVALDYGVDDSTDDADNRQIDASLLLSQDANLNQTGHQTRFSLDFTNFGFLSKHRLRTYATEVVTG